MPFASPARWALPLAVLLSLGAAALGATAALALVGLQNSVYAQIGIVLLIGIASKNAILIVEFAKENLERGMELTAATMTAVRDRLRPILMTSLTTILGLLPLALGIGEGADAQAPLARAVIGGLTSSMLTTLVLIPAAYSIFHPDPPRSSPGSDA